MQISQLGSMLARRKRVKMGTQQLMLFVAVCWAWVGWGVAHGPMADTIYHNGRILTMAGDQPAYAEALAVRQGKILSIGAGPPELLKQEQAFARALSLVDGFHTHGNQLTLLQDTTPIATFQESTE